MAFRPYQAGSIPTCVGQPSWRLFVRMQIGVYPHVCGAARLVCMTTVSVRGLSPRVWGSLNILCIQCQHDGSIPTCVGQPCRGCGCADADTVYPHVCGAASLDEAKEWLEKGLSPRVWGSQKMTHIKDVLKRSIPTCVGQPNIMITITNNREVYPHVCGAASDEFFDHFVF